MNEIEKQAKKLVEIAVNTARTSSNRNPDDRFLWADKLDGVTSQRYRLKLNTETPAFFVRYMSGKKWISSDRVYGEVVSLPPGEYTRGAAYNTPGSELIQKAKEKGFGYKLLPEIKKFLSSNDLFFPLHPVGASRSTTDIYWVRISDLQANAEELTPQEMFDKTAKGVLPAVKANIIQLKALARQKLEVAKQHEWDPIALEDAFEEFSMEAEEIIPDLDQANELHDEVWQFIETNIFNAVAKELGATDTDLEV